MENTLARTKDFYDYVTELTCWIKEEGKEFPYTERLLECGRGIYGALCVALSAPDNSKDCYAVAYRQAEEFCRLMGLMVNTGVLTEIQSRPLLSECMFIKEEVDRLQK